MVFIYGIPAFYDFSEVHLSTLPISNRFRLLFATDLLFDSLEMLLYLLMDASSSSPEMASSIPWLLSDYNPLVLTFFNFFILFLKLISLKALWEFYSYISFSSLIAFDLFLSYKRRSLNWCYMYVWYCSTSGVLDYIIFI